MSALPTHVPDKWTMPEWMEPYRDLFANTGGDTIENLMNDYQCQNNFVRSALVVSVDSQVTLLSRLRVQGMLK